MEKEEKKENEHDVHMGYASFVYYIDKKGYKVAAAGKWYLMFWREDREGQHRCQVTVGDNYPECGFVYINTGTIKKIFKDDGSLIDDLLTFCIKPHRALPLPADKEDHHCSLDSSLWGTIEPEILTRNNRKDKAKCIHPSLKKTENES